MDLLRVLALGLLIPFHALVFFTVLPEPSLRNEELAGPWVGSVIIWLHQWRLPLVFLVSGMGSAFALGARPIQEFLRGRVRRILVPLFAGVFLVNWAAAYLRSTQYYPRPPNQGLVGFLLEFWAGAARLPLLVSTDYLVAERYMQHLWFLGHLFAFTIVLVPIAVALRTTTWTPGGKNLRWAVLAIPPILLTLMGVLVKPWRVALFGSGHELAWYFVFFILGFLAIRYRTAYEAVLPRVGPAALALAPVAYLGLRLTMNLADQVFPGYSIWLLQGGWTNLGLPAFSGRAVVFTAFQASHAWLVCLAILFLGSRLARDGPRLRYATEAILPAYIMHYLPMLVVMRLANDLQIPWALKFTLVCVISVACGLAFFHLVRTTRPTRFLFGVKAAKPAEARKKP